jgi:hypothetical protein
MSSEREKLIEIWLDNAGEREYQFAFRNALLFAGYTVLHDTSHTSLELGKDIIAIDARGHLAAFQLKGNPGGRITMSQWQQLLPQINTLVYQPISHPNVKRGGKHQSYLVTNGEIHEDVYAAIAGYNREIESGKPARKPLKTIARGELLKMLVAAADTLWPADISTQRDILNAYSSPGDSVAPLKLFATILNSILRTGDGDKYSSTAVAAAHLVTSILVSVWIEKRKFFEAIKLNVVLCAAVAAYLERWKRKRRNDIKFADQIVFDVRATLKEFILDCMETCGRGPPINSSIFAEFAYYHPRKKMIAGLLSAAWLDRDITLPNDARDFIWKFVCKTKHKGFLFSEGIVPFCLAEFWALSDMQGTRRPDVNLASLVTDILNSNSDEDESRHLPNPYFDLEEVLLWRYQPFLGFRMSEIDDDSHYRRSWFLESLFFLLARRNYKQTCKIYWPEITRFLHVRTRLKCKWQFGLSVCDDAVAEDRVLKTSRSWNDVVAECGAECLPSLPDYLKAKPFLVLMYCLFVPYRMDKGVIMWLDRAFSKSWY